MPHEALRADAQQNRSRILEVAREVLTADPEASLNSIAKLAGVGPGTLYRHFPNRAALALEIYRQDIQAMADLAAALLTEHPPNAALRLWLDRLGEQGRVKQSVADLLHAVMNEAVTNEAYALMVGAIDRLLRAGEAAGTVRPGVDPEDLLLMLGFLWRIPPGPAGEARAERLLDLVMAALKAPA